MCIRKFGARRDASAAARAAALAATDSPGANFAPMAAAVAAATRLASAASSFATALSVFVCPSACYSVDGDGCTDDERAPPRQNASVAHLASYDARAIAQQMRELMA